MFVVAACHLIFGYASISWPVVYKYHLLSYIAGDRASCLPWVPTCESSGPTARPVAGVSTAVCAAVIMRRVAVLFGGTYSSTFYTKHAVNKKYGKCMSTVRLFI